MLLELSLRLVGCLCCGGFSDSRGSRALGFWYACALLFGGGGGTHAVVVCGY